MATPDEVLTIAAAEIGYDVSADPSTGSKYGRWYAQAHGSYFGEAGVPYCAMFVSWVFDQAGQECPGLPAAACSVILNGARAAGLVLADKKQAEPGDIVIFNWGDGGSTTDHVGLVELNRGSYIQTIEGNTTSGSGGNQGNGGVVARRTRNWGVVNSIIRPVWEDDMQASDVWGYNYDNSAPGGNVYNTVCFEIPGAIKALQVTVDAQTAAIKALAESQGADPDAIAKTVSDAVAKKLESIDLSVTVGD